MKINFKIPLLGTCETLFSPAGLHTRLMKLIIKQKMRLAGLSKVKFERW